MISYHLVYLPFFFFKKKKVEYVKCLSGAQTLVCLNKYSSTYVCSGLMIQSGQTMFEVTFYYITYSLKLVDSFNQLKIETPLHDIHVCFTKDLKQGLPCPKDESWTIIAQTDLR